MASEAIRVVARVRPSRHDKDQAALEATGKSICVGTKSFTFDSVFGYRSSQQDVWEGMGRQVVDGVLSGINGTIFAYGQTGSGKTYTMLGPALTTDILTHASRGVIPRCLEYLFASLETKASQSGNLSSSISCMFIECYNEGLTDLLSPNGNPVVIRGDEKKIVFHGASSETVSSTVEAIKLLNTGWENRQIAETGMNKESSRSHAIFIIDVSVEEQKNGLTSRCEARLNLVDLAGSERQAATQCTGIRLKEAGKINQSLSTLGRVIRTLSLSPSAVKHVPYRDSRLTYMIRDSLGGNSRTAVVVNLHPDTEYMAESLSTLQFAEMCGKVRNSTSVNRQISGASVAALKEEIERLREELAKCKATAEEDASQKLSSVLEESAAWKTRALDAQKKAAGLQMELDCRSRLSRKKEIPEEELLEEMKQLVSDRYSLSTTLNGYDKQALAEEMDMLRAQLEEKKELCEQYEGRLRDICQQKLSTPALNFSHSRENIENSPQMFPSLEVSKSFTMNEMISPAYSEEMENMRVINTQVLQSIEMRNAELEKEAVEQRALLEELKEMFEERERRRNKEISEALEEKSVAEREATRMKTDISALQHNYNALDDKRRQLEVRLTEVSVQRDTYLSEVAKAQKERDEAVEEKERLENRMEEQEARMEAAATQNVSLDMSLSSSVPKRDQEVQVGGANDVQLERLWSLCHEQRTKLANLELENKDLTERLKDAEVLKEQRLAYMDEQLATLEKAYQQKREVTRELNKEKDGRRRDRENYKQKLSESEAKVRSLECKLDFMSSPGFNSPKMAEDSDVRFNDRVNEMKMNFSSLNVSAQMKKSRTRMLDDWKKENEEKKAEKSKK